MHLKLHGLDDCDGLAKTLKQNTAKWHKTCRDKFNNTKLHRLEMILQKSGEHAECTEDISTTSTHQLRDMSPSTPTSSTCPKCFFCGETSGDIHEACTFNLDKKVKKGAMLIKDNNLLGKLSMGDMMSQDAIYHSKCLLLLYKKADAENMLGAKDMAERRIHGVVLAELVSYINDTKNTDKDTAVVFKLSDLSKMY